MRGAVREALGEALGGAVRDVRAIAGGDVNEAWLATLGDGRRVFVKTNPRAPRGLFAREAEGLAWLAAADALRVPQVLAVDEAFLALEPIESGAAAADHDAALGRGLAALHGASPGAFGAVADNFIATIEQDNTDADDWPTFFAARRLEPLLARAVDRGLASAAMRRGFAALLPRLADRVGPPEPPARLHGDLWGGNRMCDAAGAPVLIDPAVYGGHREIDLAMMQLFGGFSARVFDAYDEAAPLAPGWRARVPLYQLIPLMVHVLLFGGGYVGAVERALAEVA